MSQLSQFEPLREEEEDTGFFRRLFRFVSSSNDNNANNSNNNVNNNNINNNNNNNNVNNNNSLRNSSSLRSEASVVSPRSPRPPAASVATAAAADVSPPSSPTALSSKPTSSTSSSSSPFQPLRSRPWMPDELVSKCHSCDAQFTAVRRKHHCRICGQIFCSSCSDNFLDRAYFGFAEREIVRVCNVCFIGRREQLRAAKSPSPLPTSDRSSSSNNSSTSSLPQVDHMFFGGGAGLVMVPEAKRPSVPDARRHVGAAPAPVVTMVEKDARTAAMSPSVEARKKSLRPSFGVTLKRAVGRESYDDVSEIEDAPFAPTSHKLSTAGDASGGSGGFDAASIPAPGSNVVAKVLLSETDDDMVVGTPIQTFWDEGDVPSYPLDRRPSQFAWTPAAKKSLDMSGTIHTGDGPGSTSPTTSSGNMDHHHHHNGSHVDDRHHRQGLSSPSGGSGTASEHLREAKAFLAHLVSFLLNKEGLTSEQWCDALVTLAIKAVRKVHLSLTNDVMDVRRYIRVKGVLGGSVEEGLYVPGVVLHKSVALKQMRSRLERPKVLLMSCSLAFQKPESKLVEFEVLKLQERDFLRILVDRIAALGPDIVVTSDTISSIALDFLCQAGITCVTRVKVKLLERLARFTGASVVTNIFDIPSAVVGQGSGLVHVETFPSKQTILVFDKCDSKLGGTILLRGIQHANELHRLKGVLQFAVYAAYHLRMERAFFSDLSICQFPKRQFESPPVSVSPGISIKPQTDVEASAAGRTPAMFLDRATSQTCSDLLLLMQGKPGSLDVDYGKVLEEMEGGDDSMFELVAGSHCGHSVDEIRETQSLAYCFSQHSFEKRSHCIPFVYNFVKFYSPNDLSVYGFLVDFCRSNMVCTVKNCSEPHSEHEFTFLYGGARIYVSSAVVEGYGSGNGGGPGHIACWFVCGECFESTDPKPLSEDARRMSMGKLLELLCVDETLTCSQGHCVNPNGTLVFDFGGKLTSFSFLPNKVFSVEEPAMANRENLAEERLVVEKELGTLAAVIHVTYDVIKKRLGSTAIGELLDLLDKEESDLLASTQSAKDWRLLQLNRLYRLLFTNVLRWNGVFEDQLLQQVNSDNSNNNNNTSKVDLTAASAATAPSSAAATAASTSATSSAGASGAATPVLSASSDNATAGLASQHQPQQPPSLIVSSGPSSSASSTSIPSSGVGSVLPQNQPSLPSLLPQTGSTPSVRRFLEAAGGGGASAAMSTPSMRRLAGGGGEEQQVTLLARLIKKAPASAVSLQQEVAEALASMDKDSLMYRLFIGHGAPLPLSPLTNELIIALDEEPSTVIAHALGTDAYREQMHDLIAQHLTKEMAAKIGLMDYEKLDTDLMLKLSMAQPLYSQPPMEVSFESMLPRLSYKCKVTVYYPVQFAALRRLFCGGDANFVFSMARSQGWEAKKEGGGATRAKFVYTKDGLFLLKSVPSVELKNFQAFAHKYFEYLFNAHATGSPTMLVKIVGVFSLEVRNVLGNTERQDFVVMEKLFHNHQISQTFDLKGSVLNRLRPESAPVLQDENLRRMLWRTPLLVDAQSKGKFALAIWNDSFFLSQQTVMDYSILVGIDEKTQQLVVGIIDYIRPYTWDKHIEYVMKSTPGVISGTRKRPTVLSPNDYRDRFRQATWNYFTLMPNRNTTVLIDRRTTEGAHEEEPEPVQIVVSFDE